MSHKGHATCVYTSKAACEAAAREVLGKCVEMTADQRTPTQCRQWASSIVDDRAICNMHAEGLLTRALAARKSAQRKADLDARLDAYIARTVAHPSVWPD